MKKIFKSATFILTAVILLSMMTPVCCADGKLSELTVEQVDIRVPEVNAYVYPIDAQGEVILSMTEKDTMISAFLEDENLTVNSFSSANDEGCCFIIVLNTSGEEIGYENLRIFKNDIEKYIDKLTDRDRLILITSSKTCETVLEGTESRDSAKRLVDGIAPTTGISDLNDAFDEAIRLSNLEKNSTPARHVLVLYDKGAFLKDNRKILEKAENRLSENNLPLYFACTSNTDEVQKEAYSFAKATGGMTFRAGTGYAGSVSEKMAAWIKSCYLLKATGRSNDPEPRDRSLRIVFTGGDAQLTIDRPVVITENIPDTEAPAVLSLQCEDETHIRVVFSEDVLNADNPGSYTVEAASDGKKIRVSEAVYDGDVHSVLLTFEEAMKNGDYTLRIANVTDTSYEANELAASGSDEHSFSWDNGKKFPIPVEYLYIAGGAAALIVLIIIIASVSRKKEKREIEAILDRENKTDLGEDINPDDGKTVGFVNRVDVENGLPVSLKIKMPNGLNTKLQITVGEGFLVGRSAKANLKIDDETVSSQHMILSNVQNKLVVTDNNSTNGTYLNGLKIDRPRPVNPGDRLHIGNTDIIIDY